VFSNFLEYRTMDKVQNPVIPSVIQNRQNPLESTLEFATAVGLVSVNDRTVIDTEFKVSVGTCRMERPTERHMTELEYLPAMVIDSYYCYCYGYHW
jgi:hypothetical protein